VGVVEVPDPRLAELARIVQPQRIVPAIVEFVDIAGLVAGASKGEGLGNQFLANIRETDAIVHVVRCFEDANVVHVAGGVDPIRDIEVIDTELALADLATVEKALDPPGASRRSPGTGGQGARGRARTGLRPARRRQAGARALEAVGDLFRGACAKPSRSIPCRRRRWIICSHLPHPPPVRDARRC